MFKKMIKPIALILCLSFCLGFFPSCQKADSLAKDGFSSLKVNAKTEKVTASVTVNARTLQAHAGEILSLYELLPGETAAVCSEREPIATKKIGAKVSFQFDLVEEERTRLYSTFVVMLEDGSFLSENSCPIENPQVLAENTEAFGWTSSPKGLCAQNIDNAASLGVMHVMFELSLFALCNGSDTTSFLGNTYSYSERALTKLDAQVRAASDAGMQISLTLIPDYLPSSLHAAAYFDLIAARYSGEEYGVVSAFFIGSAEETSVDEIAFLARIAHQAIRSRVANARVYIESACETLEGAKTFFADLQSAIARNGSFEWGAAAAPTLSDTPWAVPLASSESAETPLTVSNLSALSSQLFSSARQGKTSYFAVTSLAFSAEDPDTQAAALAYSYRSAALAKANLIFYASHLDQETGLYAEDGSSRLAASVFASLDTGLSVEQDAQIALVAGDAWKSLSESKVTRTVQKGSATLGTGDYEEESLFDFSTGETLGFTGIGSVTDPISYRSVSLSVPVLYTWLEPSLGNEAGVRKVLSDGSSLDGAMSLSVKFLTQVPDVETCRLRLSLTGKGTDGKMLTYTSEIDVSNGNWQTVTFQISPFVVAADLSAPCILSLTCEPETETDAEYVFWVRSVNARYPEDGLQRVLPWLLILGGTVLGFAGIFLLYCQTQKKKRPKRR